jgi:hypothetical protein
MPAFECRHLRQRHHLQGYRGVGWRRTIAERKKAGVGRVGYDFWTSFCTTKLVDDIV